MFVDKNHATNNIRNAVKPNYVGKCFIPLTQWHTKAKKLLPKILSICAAWSCTRKKQQTAADAHARNSFVTSNSLNTTSIEIFGRFKRYCKGVVIQGIKALYQPRIFKYSRLLLAHSRLGISLCSSCSTTTHFAFDFTAAFKIGSQIC